jgi:carboxymethylenebutenolidase
MELAMTELTRDQQAILATWRQHTHAEFVLKDADAALATMTENPYVFLVASGVARTGRAAVHEFYANKFLPNLPADLELTSLSQTFGADRIVEEIVMRFTHTIEMDWLLPRVRPTRRSAEFALVGVVQFKSGKIAAEHLYWDQATVLSQLGLPNHQAVAGFGSAARLLQLRTTTCSPQATGRRPPALSASRASAGGADDSK